MYIIIRKQTGINKDIMKQTGINKDIMKQTGINKDIMKQTGINKDIMKRKMANVRLEDVNLIIQSRFRFNVVHFLDAGHICKYHMAKTTCECTTNHTKVAGFIKDRTIFSQKHESKCQQFTS